MGAFYCSLIQRENRCINLNDEKIGQKKGMKSFYQPSWYVEETLYNSKRKYSARENMGRDDLVFIFKVKGTCPVCFSPYRHCLYRSEAFPGVFSKLDLAFKNSMLIFTVIPNMIYCLGS